MYPVSPLCPNFENTAVERSDLKSPQNYDSVNLKVDTSEELGKRFHQNIKNWGGPLQRKLGYTRDGRLMMEIEKGVFLFQIKKVTK